MEFVSGADGYKIPTVGLGTWLATDEEELSRALDSALEIGYRHFDCAYVYRNEAVLGQVLKKWLDSGKVTRDELFIVTKLPTFANNPERVGKFIKKSLAALQLEYVDLYLMHTPFGTEYKEETDSFPIENGQVVFDNSSTIEEVWKAMENVVDSKRAKSIGISNFDEDQVRRIWNMARIQPACLQVEIHAYLQQKSLRDLCETYDIRVVAYSPLGSPGRKEFYGKIGLNFEPSNMLENSVVTKIASEHEKSPAQILLRFLVQQGIIVIPKSTSPQRLRENFQILDFALRPEDMEALKGLDKGEIGRTVIFDFLPGIPKHPEFPKNIKKSLELLGK